MNTKIVIDWQLSPFFGWGVYGLNLALECATDPAIEASSTYLVEPGRLGIDALRARALTPFAARSGWRRRDAVGLHALGNELLPIAHAGDRVGVIFFEQPLSADAIGRAKAHDLIITGSTWNERVLRDAGVTQVRTVLQGIDPTLFHPAPRRNLYPGRFLVFSGGKAEPRKGQDLVVKAFRVFAQRHPEAMLVTAWHSPWPQLAAGMDLDLSGLKDRVIDVGGVPNALMPPIYRECDVALFPNRAEGGTNLVAMECLACGVPTILSKNTGHLDLVDRRGVLALERQAPGAIWSEWGESDVDEIVAALELAIEQRRAPLGYSPIAELTWSRTAAGLLAALGDLPAARAAA